MLSISVIKQSATNASNYYLNEEKNYYLSEKSVAQNTQWYGNGAAKNGILGKEVSQSELEHFLSGKTYDGAVSTSFTGKLRRGWDFTLSAPKSVSILALVYDDKALLKAHDVAVKQTLSQIEKDCAQVRVFDKESQKMTFQNTGNVIAAMIRHATSREMDPQLHTHVLICNISYDLLGKVRAMASCREQGGDVVQGMSERVYRDQKYYTAIYQSTLAKLATELGYTVKSIGNGQFEIAGIPEAAMLEFSQRREQIIEQARAFGVTTSKGMDVATQRTRKNKVFATLDELKDLWNKRHITFDINEIKNNKNHEITHQITSDDSAKKTVELALSHLGRFQTKVRYEKLMETALGKFAIAANIDYKQCQQAIENKIQLGELIPLDKNGSVFTTKVLLEKEKHLINTANTKFHHFGCEVDTELLNQLQLNSENRNKIISIMQSSKQAVLVDTHGSKKQIIESLLHVSENSGMHVKVLSPNRIEKNQLARVSDRQSTTLSQWIKNQFKGDFHDTVNHYLQADIHPKEKLIIVDQANRLGVDEITQLLKKTQDNHAKIIFLNDTNKIKSFRFGNSIKTLKQADIFKLSWNNNRTSHAIVNIHEIKNDQVRSKNIIHDYVNSPLDKRLKTQVIALSGKEVMELNSQIRDVLKSIGEISRIERSFINLTPVFLSGEEKQIIKNYQTGMMVKIFDAGESGKLIKIQTLIIDNVNKPDNKLTLKDESGKFQHTHIDDISKKQFMLFKIDKMAIAKGDVIRPLVDIKQHSIQAGDQLLVKSDGVFGIGLQNQDGKTIRITQRDLEGQSFAYNYAKSISSAASDMNHTLFLVKSYAANDKILNTLLEKTQHAVDIYTDNESKIKSKLAQNYMQPTAINTVIDSAERMDETHQLEKFVNEKTADAVKLDLESALLKINENSNKTTVERSVEFALSKISERQAAFRHQDLVKEALSFALSEIGAPLSNDQIEEKLTTLKSDGLLLSADYEDGTRWTTKESLLLEKNILKLIQDGKKQVEPLAEKAFVTQSLDATQLTTSQKEAVFLITTTQDRFIAIQGLPGTGKSTMLQNVISIVNEVKKMTDRKIEFVGLAPTWQAVNELRQKGVDAQTFASFLQVIKSNTFDKKKYKSTVFLFDEASMASNKNKSDFLTALHAANSRAIDIGDMEQLQGQGAGKPFELSIKRGVIDCVYLTDIIRQNPSPILKLAVQDIVDKRVKSSFEHIEKQHALNAKNIIETYKKVTGDPKLDKELSKKEILIQGASEYLNRTPDSRKNSIFIAYSNRERDEFSCLVRDGLMHEGLLNKLSEIPVERLRPLNLTRAEMRTMDAYTQKSDADNKLILSIGKEKYFAVDSVDKQSKLVTLIDTKTKEIKIFNPARSDHSNTCLWNQSTQKLAEGDLVMMRRADKDRNHISNIEYTVQHIDKQSKAIELKNSDGTLTLDTKELKDCHWDYAYAKTSDMAQGSTKKFMVPMVYSESPLTDIRRALVDMSRASTHAMLITDNKEALIQRLEGKTLQSSANNHGDKRSALDTIEKVAHAPAQYFSDRSEINAPSDTGKMSESAFDSQKYHSSSPLANESASENKNAMQTQTISTPKKSMAEPEMEI